MKKMIAVILAAVLVTLWSAGCFAEAGQEGLDELFCHIREMWTDEEQSWYGTYFAGLGPYSMSSATPDPKGRCSVAFVLDAESVQLSANTEHGGGIRYTWYGMTPYDQLLLCGEMCRAWKDFEEFGALRMVVVYEEKGITLVIQDEESAQAFLKKPFSDFRADRYGKEAKGLCGYILNEWLDGVSPYYRSYFSKHDPYVKKDFPMPEGDLCGIIFVLDNGIIDLMGTDADGNGVEFEWSGFEAGDMMFMCWGMCRNWEEYKDMGTLKILLTYAEKDASLMIKDEESVGYFMNLFGELYPGLQEKIEAAVAE